MPTYNFQDRETGELVEKFMTISAYTMFKEQNPNLEPVIGSPMICDPIYVGVAKRDTGFKEVLQKIHERAPGSRLKQNNAW